MSRQYWSETVSAATASGTSVNTSTAEAIVFPNITIPANYMQDGRVLRLTLYGHWGSTATPTQTWRVRWGGLAGTVIAASGAIVTGSGVTLGQWKMELLIQVRTNGATGTVFAQGDITLHEDAVATMGTVTNYGCVSPMGSAGVTTPAAVTVDLTADTALSVTVQHSASSASNLVVGNLYTLEAMN